MRKLTTIILAIAALVFIEACNKSEVQFDDSVFTLDYTASLVSPATRAIGDVSNVDKMVYAIFDESGAQVKKEVVDKNGDRFSFSPALYYGKKYKIVLFAYKEGAYDVSDINAVTRLLNGKDADAFKHQETVMITQDGKLSINGEEPIAATTRNVTLTRPFAQLAVGTENLDDLTKSEVTKVQVTVKEYDNGDLSYEMEVSDFTNSDTFEVASNTYYCVSVNYLSPTDVKTVEIQLKKNDNTVVRTIECVDVPLKANKKTQIYGNLVKDELIFSVTVNAGFDEWNPSDKGQIEL